MINFKSAVILHIALLICPNHVHTALPQALMLLGLLQMKTEKLESAIEEMKGSAQILHPIAQKPTSSTTTDSLCLAGKTPCSVMKKKSVKEIEQDQKNYEHKITELEKQKKITQNQQRQFIEIQKKIASKINNRQKRRFKN